MNIFNRHGPCRGVTLFRGWNLNIELWWCPSGYRIEPHVHTREHAEIMYLWGDVIFHRKMGSQYLKFMPRWWHTFRCFSIPNQAIHWFEVGKRPLIFINFARFLIGKPTSASKDFLIVSPHIYDYVTT